MDQVDTQTNQQSTPQQPAQPPPTPAVSTGVQRQTNSNYFSNFFSGRINRRNYFIAGILLWILSALIDASNFNTFTQNLFSSQLSTHNANSSLMYFLDIPISIIIIFSYFSLAIRRLHDLNKTGLLTLVTFIPFIGQFYGLYLLFALGTVGENIYGAQPLPRININHDILRL